MSKIFKFIGIPTILVLVVVLYFSINVLRDSPLGHSLLVQEYRKDIFEKLKTDKLMKGDIIAGQFIASEDNLSITLVRFFNFYHISKDQIVFRIREKGKSDWYYQGTYKVDQFQPNQYFTIGFPPIEDSRGKTYLFEIESVAGVPLDAIGISNQSPQFAVAYKMNTQNLKSDVYLLVRYILKKSYFTVSQIDYKTITLLFILFFILNYLYQTYTNKVNKAMKNIVIFGALTIINIKLLLLHQRARDNLFHLLIQKRFAIYNRVLNYYIEIDRYHKRKYSELKGSRLIKRFAKNIIIAFSKRHSIFFGIILIFVVALLSRIEYYLNGNNFGSLLYSGIGGSGDYDLLFKNALSVFRESDLVSYHWSFLNDHIFLTRFYWFLFKNFGFLNGLDYSAWFFIIISSVVCTTPFILTSRLSRFSLGGMYAGLLFALDPLSIWLSSTMVIDTSTALTFSLFVMLFFLALEKSDIRSVILLGFVGFIDVLNRGLMFFNDGPALMLFALYYLYQQSNITNVSVYVSCLIKNKSLKVIGKELLQFIFRLRYKIIYALTPITIYAALSILFDFYYFNTFDYHWPFRIDSLYLDFIPVTDVNNILGGPAAEPKSRIINYLILQFLMLRELADAMVMPKIFIIPFILLVLIQIKNRKYYIPFLLVLLYVAIFYTVPYLLTTFKLENMISDYPKRLITLENKDYLEIYILLTFIASQAVLLKQIFPRLFLSVFIYIIALGYGIYVSFSDRHFIQVLVVWYFLLAFSLGKLFNSNIYQKNKYIKRFLLLVICGVLTSYIGVTFFNKISKVSEHLGYFYLEREYLEHVDSVLPKDAVILVGGGIENPIWISNYAKRTIIFNSWLSSPLTIPYGEKDMYVLYSIKKTGMPKYDFTSPGSKGISLRSVMSDNNEFKKNKLYVLDNEVQKWNKYFTIDNYGHPFIKAHYFKLKLVDKNANGREIYQIVLSNERSEN